MKDAHTVPGYTLQDDPDAPYEVFIAGETVDLVVPSVRAVVHDGWHRWFNDPDVTRYSDYGLYPNTREAQYEYFKAMRDPANKSRLGLLIIPKGEEKPVGIASLSNIHPIHLSAETAIVIGERPTSRGALFWGMEAKARIVEHGFEVLGLKRIGGAQAMPLANWQNYQVLFGFRPEGVKRDAHRRGHQVWDSVISSCSLADYLAVKAAREGAYWPGREKLLELMRSVPRYSLSEAVKKAIDESVAEFVGDMHQT
jgi:hypothetical protein